MFLCLPIRSANLFIRNSVTRKNLKKPTFYRKLQEIQSKAFRMKVCSNQSINRSIDRSKNHNKSILSTVSITLSSLASWNFLSKNYAVYKQDIRLSTEQVEEKLQTNPNTKRKIHAPNQAIDQQSKWQHKNETNQSIKLWVPIILLQKGLYTSSHDKAKNVTEESLNLHYFLKVKEAF